MIVIFISRDNKNNNKNNNNNNNNQVVLQKGRKFKAVFTGGFFQKKTELKDHDSEKGRK